MSTFRKTHHESWTGLSSTKERLALEQKYVKKYMLGKASAVDILLSQFREKWMKEKEKKKKKMLMKETQLKEASQDDTEKTGDLSKKKKDGEISQEEEKRRRETTDEVSRHQGATYSGEINKEKKEGELRDEKQKKIKRTQDDFVKQKEETEEEEEAIDTEFFKDSKNHKALQLAIEVQDAIATHGLVPMVSKEKTHG